MTSVKQQIILHLKSAVKEITNLEVEPEISRPTITSHGDYSTNIAMFLISKLKNQRSKPQLKTQKFNSPMELAENIAQTFNSQLSTLNFLSKVEAVAPGFINFWLSNDCLIDSLTQIDSKEKTSSYQGKKIMVEFAHPNTHKEFHIGHLRTITIGESICRLLKFTGAEIFRANYQGDIGLHVAKAMWGLQKKFKVQSSKFKVFEELEKQPVKEKVKVLADAYTKGAKAYEEDKEAKKEIQEINKKIYEKDSSILELWEKTRKWSLEYFDLIYKRLGSHFDRLYFESEVFAKGKQIVEKHVQDGIFVKDQDAIIFNGEKYGLHKRVFVTREGNVTYEGKEMALGFLEYANFPFDLCVHVVAQEQADYFKVVFKALELIDGKFKTKEKHLSYGMVELKSGKMSSRSGNVITADWLLDEVKARIKKNFPEMDDETAEKVAVGAVKYSMLKVSPASNISFSFEESISLEGNSGPYIQYTFARTQSVLRKAKADYVILSTFDKLSVNSAKDLTDVRDSSATPQNDINKLETEEISLLRVLHQFPEIVGEAAENFAPNLLCNYLFDLSQKFNLFYQKCPILESEQRDFRLNLTTSVGQVLKQGLSLLGIEAVDRM